MVTLRPADEKADERPAPMTVKQAWMVYTLLPLLMIYLLRSTPTLVAARLLCKGAYCLSKLCFGKSQRWLPLKQPRSGWTDFRYFIWQLSVAASCRLVPY